MPGKIAFATAFRAAAHKLNTYAIAGRWLAVRDEVPALTAEEAAAWANLGYLPEEAAPQIRAGITAAATREMEDYAAEQAGGGEALAAMRLAEILASDGMYGPDDAIVVQDPLNPGQEVIMLREDLDR